MAEEQKLDRKLGDEWEDWTGESTPVAYAETSAPFVLFGILAVLLVDALGIAVLYMIQPRLGQWHPYAVLGVDAVGLGLLLFFTVWFLGLVLGVASGVNVAARGPLYRFFLERFGPLVFWLGVKLGVDRDRLFNSFLYVNNTMVRRAVNVGDPSKVLVLLPRCLSAQTIKDLKSFGEETGAKVAVAGGGDQAREFVRKFKPRAIVAVACERDLVSGLRDVGAKIPVIALANERPEGPCKNTCVPLASVREAVARLSGR